MTATSILESLSREFSARPEHVQSALDLIDAGLSTPFIGRFRRAPVGSMSESFLRRLQRRRTELEELDRRRGTVLRLLEKEPGIPAGTIEAIQRCMDRFELEDLFIPHRRPEPEVQLALDRGLGALADALVAAVPKAEREALGMREDEKPEHDEKDEDDAPRGGRGEAAHDGPATDHSASAEGSPAPASVNADESSQSADANAERGGSATAVLELAASEPAGDATEAAQAHDDSDESAAEAAPTLDAPAAHVPHVHIDPKTVMNAQLARLCQPFVNPDRGVHTEAEALSGALRILSDRLGRNARLRGLVRRILGKHGVLTVRPIGGEGRVGRHRSLLKVKQPLRQLQGHRLLSIRQAQKERVLNTIITLDPTRALPKVRQTLGRFTHPAHEEVLREVSLQALQHRLLPMVEQDVRLELKERADFEALRFLSQHLRQMLFTPPLVRENVAGIDVNAKGDWVIVPLDQAGTPLADETRIELKNEAGDKDAATIGKELAPLLDAHHIRCIAVGHGKGPRNAVNKIRAALQAVDYFAYVFVVNESGLSSYANSEFARHELAGKSIPARLAISLGRRLQDPAAEILKVDPRHLGLGVEQGLVSKANARRIFQETIESCVAHIGCDVNHAPLSVLMHMPGLGKEAAQKIVARRAERPFTSREELRSEGVLDEAQWTNAIAFLRVHGSTEPLDRTALHPEQYALVRNLFDSAGTTVENGLGRMGSTRGLRCPEDIDEGTWRDITREMTFPGRDPRPRQRLPELLDPATDPVRLVQGRVIEGVVTNVASFGAFVDVGLATDAMVHISEVSDRYVRDAREVLSIGQVVRAKIQEATGPRLALSLKNVPRPERPERPAPAQRSGPREGAHAGGGEGGGRGGGGGGGGRRGERRGRDDRFGAPKPAGNVRAAQSRRDGLAGGRPARGGRGGPGGRGEGGRGDRPRGEERLDRDDRAHLDNLNQGAKKSGAFSPFASFFKAKPGDAETPAS